MSVWNQFCTFVSHLFTEPACNMNIPWQLPLMIWPIGLYFVFELLNGTFRTNSQWIWSVAQLAIVSRFESLTIALILSIFFGKCPTPNGTPVYIYVLLIWLAHVAYIGMSIAAQVRVMSQECVEILDKALEACT